MMRIPYIMSVAALALSLCGCGDGARNVNGIYVLDGDTFDAGPFYHRTRYRLARIDAPEMPGHCRVGRHCVNGDPYWSADTLVAFLNDGDIRCKVVGHDVYDRSLAECFNDHGNVSDEMLRVHAAEEYRR
jgi:micrococcal nuclease